MLRSVDDLSDGSARGMPMLDAKAAGNNNRNQRLIHLQINFENRFCSHEFTITRFYKNVLTISNK